MTMQETKQSFIADKTDYPRLIKFVTDFASQFTDSRRITNDLAVTLDELFSNVAFYASEGGDSPAEVTVKLNCDGKVLTLVFSDNGRPFNPLEVPAPSLEENRRSKTVGGLGIFMVRRLMDGVSYEYDNRNILTLKKKLLEE